MHRISRRMVAVVVLIGAIAAGGAAFTASNTIPDTVAGYGTSHITGADAHTLNYQISSDGTTITEADLSFIGDLTGDVVTAGFNTDNLQNCTVGAYDGNRADQHNHRDHPPGNAVHLSSLKAQSHG
jgi:hypothetical protein